MQQAAPCLEPCAAVTRCTRSRLARVDPQPSVPLLLLSFFPFFFKNIIIIIIIITTVAATSAVPPAARAPRAWSRPAALQSSSRVMREAAASTCDAMRWSLWIACVCARRSADCRARPTSLVVRRAGARGCARTRREQCVAARAAGSRAALAGGGRMDDAILLARPSVSVGPAPRPAR